MPRTTTPNLPPLLKSKIYKTGQTRGADDDVIFQNRVSRNSTVLFPYSYWNLCKTPSATEAAYENGFIVLLSPSDYFQNATIEEELAAKGLALGTNALVFYETRAQWLAFPPSAVNWTPANQRTAPLGGQYVARIAATTAAVDGERLNFGFTGKPKGAGIRVYEYASTKSIEQCRLQLEALYWMCADAIPVALANGMSQANIDARKEGIFATGGQLDLLDLPKLTHQRMLNSNGRTTCPLCLEELSAQGFFDRMEQAEGRAVHDLTVTKLNLFHIDEVRLGSLNHRPYNLGWGHHHCNVVVKDSGIDKTLQWMQAVVARNLAEGHLPVASNKAS